MNERLSTPDGLLLEPAPSLPEASVLLPDLGPALPPTVQQRLAVIQGLLRYQGSDCYSEMQRQAAQTLGLSLRGVQRLGKHGASMALLASPLALAAIVAQRG